MSVTEEGYGVGKRSFVFKKRPSYLMYMTRCVLFFLKKKSLKNVVNRSDEWTGN